MSVYCVVRFTPHTVELQPMLKPFIPDMIPAVADIDAMLKVVSLLSLSKRNCFTMCQNFVYSEKYISNIIRSIISYSLPVVTFLLIHLLTNSVPACCHHQQHVVVMVVV